MAIKTGISWCDSTWNPLRGCSRVSEGCRNCYAEIQAAKASGPGEPYEGLAETRADEAHWTGKVVLVEKHLEDPLRWQRPRRIFVNSMSDLFHESVSWEKTIDRIFEVMAQAESHTFQVLTKRAKNMRDYVQDWYRRTQHPILKNVWLGVSVEDQAAANERIPFLLDTPAIERFISAEPLLGPIDLGEAAAPNTQGRAANQGLGIRHLDWVIVGGESGPNFRPMKKEWAESLREQCAKARPEVEFFFKQDSDEKPGQRPDLLGGIYQTMPMLASYDFEGAPFLRGKFSDFTKEQKAELKAKTKVWAAKRAKEIEEEGFDE